MAGRQRRQLLRQEGLAEQGLDFGRERRGFVRDVFTTLLGCKPCVVINIDIAMFVQFKRLVTHACVLFRELNIFYRLYGNESGAVEKAIVFQQNDEIISSIEKCYAPPSTPQCASGI